MTDKPRLDDLAAQRFDNSKHYYAQFGESDCLAVILELIGEGSRVCVEFGASDGLTCSNTAHLWRDEGWRAVLIEADAARYDALVRNADGYDVQCLRAHVTPTGPESLEELLYADAQFFDDINGNRVPKTPVLTDRIDVLSIDVDGDDAHIMEASLIGIRPRIVIAEFNPSCPPHLEIRQRELGETFGASLLAMVRLGTRLGYQFVGATHCNAFFVIADEAAPFDDYVTDLAVLCPQERYTYACSDFGGRMVLAGAMPPWQAHGPYVLPLEASCYVTPISDDPAYLRTGFEQLWGEAQWFTTGDLDRERLRGVLAESPPLVCIDLSGGTLMADDWLAVGAEFPAYKAVRSGPVLGLVKQ